MNIWVVSAVYFIVNVGCEHSCVNLLLYVSLSFSRAGFLIGFEPRTLFMVLQNLWPHPWIPGIGRTPNPLPWIIPACLQRFANNPLSASCAWGPTACIVRLAVGLQVVQGPEWHGQGGRDAFLGSGQVSPLESRLCLCLDLEVLKSLSLRAWEGSLFIHLPLPPENNSQEREWALVGLKIQLPNPDSVDAPVFLEPGRLVPSPSS